MALKLLTLYNEVSKTNFEKNDDDDIFDKLSRKFSTILMVIFSFVISTATLVGDPIKCWCPNEFSGSRCSYATTHCYITSQYIPLSNDTNLPSREKLVSHKIIYYQWIVYIFLFQAILFYFPFLIWKWLNSKSGFSIEDYIAELRKEKSLDPSNVAIRYVANHLKSSLKIKRNYVHRGLIKGLFIDRLRLRCFTNINLFITHLFVKFLYLCFALLQIVMLNYWLRDHYFDLYTNLFYSLIDTFKWNLQYRFPRMTLCSFEVYVQMNEKQKHWLQCALPLNFFIEKIYIFIRLWLLCLVTLTFVGIIYSIWKIVKRKTFIKNLLSKTNHSKDIDRIYKLLGVDGALVLMLISTNTNDINVCSILNHFFENNQEIKTLKINE